MTLIFLALRSEVDATVVAVDAYPAVVDVVLICAVVLWFLQSFLSPASAAPLVRPRAISVALAILSAVNVVMSVSFVDKETLPHVMTSREY